MRIILFFAIIGLSFNLWGNSNVAVLDSMGLRVNVRHDPKVDALLNYHRNVVAAEQGIQGFRVQISADSGNQSKQRAQRSKAAFDAMFPEVNSYIIFDSPEFKLRVGNFRTRLDAHRFLEQISGLYPAAFIVVDRINFPDFNP